MTSAIYITYIWSYIITMINSICHYCWSSKRCSHQQSAVHALHVWILYGFPCEMDFSHHESPNPARVAMHLYGFPCEKSISHGKPYKMHFSRIFYTLTHFNQAKFTGQSCRSWKPCEMDYLSRMVFRIVDSIYRYIHYIEFGYLILGQLHFCCIYLKQ